MTNHDFTAVIFVRSIVIVSYKLCFAREAVIVRGAVMLQGHLKMIVRGAVMLEGHLKMNKNWIIGILNIYYFVKWYN